MDKMIASSRRFRLFETRRKKQGKVYGKPVYLLTMDEYETPAGLAPHEFRAEVRKVVDPMKKRGTEHTRRWRYDTKATAEKHYMLLVLTWE